MVTWITSVLHSNFLPWLFSSWITSILHSNFFLWLLSFVLNRRRPFIHTHVHRPIKFKNICTGRCEAMNRSIHLTSTLPTMPMECNMLPFKWTELMRQHVTQLRTRYSNSYFFNADENFNVLLAHNGRVVLLNPKEQFHLDLNINLTTQSVRLDGRLGELWRDLDELARRWPMPDAIFWPNVFDVPKAMTSTGPTIARGGYEGHVIAIPRWISNKATSDIQATNSKYLWPDKREQVHWFGNRYSSLMPADKALTEAGFRVRQEYPRLAKMHPNLLVNRQYPYEEWGQFKYLLYLDGSGTSDRLMFQLAVKSAVFIPQPWASRPWMADFLKPWEHFVPVSRNLSDLVEKVQWARAHDQEVHLIARRASGMMAHVWNERNRACATFVAIRSIAQTQKGVRIVTRGDSPSPLACQLQECDPTRVGPYDELYS